MTRITRTLFAAVLVGAIPFVQGQDNDAVELDAVTVKAFERDYVESDSTTGLGIAADSKDIPLSFLSIPIDILEDQQVNNVEDALRNVSGVTKFKQGNGGEEKFSIRGFDASQSIYKDGARVNNRFNATNIATTETANIERYDVLKGPAAILYGAGEPGGVINYVTKKPFFAKYSSVEVMAGSYDYYRVEVDHNAPINDSLAFRVVASYQDSEANRAHTFRERLLVAPSLAWQITESTDLVLQYEYITDDYTQDRGQILDGDAISGFFYSDRLNDGLFFGIPDYNDQTNSDFNRYAAILTHRFNPNSKLTVNASSTRVEKTLFDTNALPTIFLPFFGIPPVAGPPRVVLENGDVYVSPRGQGGDGESDSINIRHELNWEQSTSVSHQFLFGLSYEQIFNDTLAFGTNTPFVLYNINTLTYSGIPDGGVQPTASAPSSQTDEEQETYIVQDLISLGEHWTALVGASYSSHDNKIADVTNNEFSPRLGLVYQPQDNLSYYASWSNGFVPTTATGFNPATGNGIGGTPINPETSEQFEVGVKVGLLQDTLQLTASIFDVAKQDIAFVDPAASALPPAEQWSINAGETRTRGLDLQIVGEVNEAIRIIAGYAYLDNELVNVAPEFTGREGNTLPGIPEHSFNIWGVYEFQEGPAEGLGFGLGLFSQTDIFASTENRAEYGGFAQIDAAVYYKKDNWKAQLNIKNLNDEEYNLAQAGNTDDAFAAIRVGTNPPLQATGSVSFEF